MVDTVSYYISLTEERYTTLTGIVLFKKREADGKGHGPWWFFVNDKPVTFWTYERSKGEFYTETYEIGDCITEIPLT